MPHTTAILIGGGALICLAAAIALLGSRRVASQVDVEAVRNPVFPTERALSEIDDEPFLIDLRTSQMSGLIMFDTQANVERVLGAPQRIDDAEESWPIVRLLYPSRGVAVDIDKGRLYTLRMVFDPDMSDGIFVGQDAPVSPCVSVVASTDGRRVPLNSDTTLEQVGSALGDAKRTELRPDGSTVVTCIGRRSARTYRSIRFVMEFGTSGRLNSARIAW